MLCNILKPSELGMVGKTLTTWNANIYQVLPYILQQCSSKTQYITVNVAVLSSMPNCVRHMSMWPKGFEDPAAHKRDFPELRNTGEFQTKALSPIKSASSSATCSLFKDPLVQKFHRLCTLHGRSEVAENNLRVSSKVTEKALL